MDIAFCLDTTGSMQGLIDEAKARIQEIDSDLRSGHPTPSVRFGLVAYRDRGEKYVTKLFGFDPQVERMTETLSEIDAEGGGDTEEHVVAGLRRAVEDLDWDPQASVKFLFLVGDAPPHLDYGEESDIEPVLAAAAAKGIVLGSLVYGDEMSEEGHAFWRNVAGDSRGLTEGVVGDDLGFESMLLLSIHREAAKHGISYGPKSPTQVDDPLLVIEDHK
ncbi:MAG: VWA domain-containing protein [Thermoanaerobaculia bacterium]|nr:VWA domain-containing protein [Thermoanaerobaculia bacterium]